MQRPVDSPEGSRRRPWVEISELSSSPVQRTGWFFGTKTHRSAATEPPARETDPLLAQKPDQSEAVNLNHLEDVFDGYDLDLARILVGANPLVSFFTGLLVMGVMLGASFVVHNTDREKHYFWLPAPHTAALVFFLSSIPLTFIWPRCCGSNKPRLSVSKLQQVFTLLGTLILYGVAMFCLWYSPRIQQTANNYNLLVIIFSFVPILQIASTLPWTFERGDILSGITSLMIFASSISLCVEPYLGFWLNFAADWKLLLACVAFAFCCAGWITALRRCLLISGFRWTLLAHNLSGFSVCLALSFILHPAQTWQKFFQMIPEWSLIWPLLSAVAVLFTFHWGCLANCYFSDSITFSSLLWIGFILGSGKMYDQIRYGASDWTPEFISGIVLLSLGAILTQYRLWTCSKRIPARYMIAFPPPPDFFTVNGQTSTNPSSGVIV